MSLLISKIYKIILIHARHDLNHFEFFIFERLAKVLLIQLELASAEKKTTHFLYLFLFSFYVWKENLHSFEMPLENSSRKTFDTFFVLILVKIHTSWWLFHLQIFANINCKDYNHKHYLLETKIIMENVQCALKRYQLKLIVFR